MQAQLRVCWGKKPDRPFYTILNKNCFNRIIAPSDQVIPKAQCIDLKEPRDQTGYGITGNPGVYMPVMADTSRWCDDFRIASEYYNMFT